MTIIDLFHDSARVDTPTTSSAHVLTMPTRFDVHQVPLFDNIFNNMLEPQPRMILIDAQEVLHIDQAGINALMAASERAAAVGTLFRVVSSTTLRVALELVLDLPDASSLFGNELFGMAA